MHMSPCNARMKSHGDYTDDLKKSQNYQQCSPCENLHTHEWGYGKWGIYGLMGWAIMN